MRLGEKHRAVVVLRLFHDYSTRETARDPRRSRRNRAVATVARHEGTRNAPRAVRSSRSRTTGDTSDDRPPFLALRDRRRDRAARFASRAPAAFAARIRRPRRRAPHAPSASSRCRARSSDSSCAIVPIVAAASLMLAAYNWWGARGTSASSTLDAALNLPQVTLRRRTPSSSLFGRRTRRWTRHDRRNKSHGRCWP